MAARRGAGALQQHARERVVIGRHAAQRAVAVERDGGDAGRRTRIGEGRQRRHADHLHGLRRLHQRLVGGKHDVRPERGGKRGVGLRRRGIGEDHVEADRGGAGRAQALDEAGVQAARPRPLHADLGHRGLVDGDDHGTVRGQRRRGERRQEVEDARLGEPPRPGLRGAEQDREDRGYDDEEAGAAGKRRWRVERARRGARQAAVHQKRALMDPVKVRRQPGVDGPTSKRWSRRL